MQSDDEAKLTLNQNSSIKFVFENFIVFNNHENCSTIFQVELVMLSFTIKCTTHCQNNIEDKLWENFQRTFKITKRAE